MYLWHLAHHRKSTELLKVKLYHRQRVSIPIHNSDIARIFNQIADLLEISSTNTFRVRTYRSAARTVSDQAKSVATMLEEGEDLSTLLDIGTRPTQVRTVCRWKNLVSTEDVVTGQETTSEYTWWLGK